MNAISLSSSRRSGTGKGSCRRLRYGGALPGVVYGYGIEEPVLVTLDPAELKTVLENPKGFNAVIDLAIEGGETHKVMVRELQRHPVSRALIHVDLVTPKPDREMLSVVPLRLAGKAPGLEAGGEVQMPRREVKVLSTAENIPSDILVDVGTLDLGGTIMASELSIHEGASVVFDRDFVVARCVTPRGIEETEEEEGEGDTEEAV